MSDTMTMYADGKETVTTVDGQPDIAHPGQFLLKNPDGAPLCCKLSLKEHAYNIVLPAGSYVIIDADEAEVLKDSRSDDRVIFALSSDNPDEFYAEQYVASAKGQAPYTVLALRLREKKQLVSAALYPRDLESLSVPLFITQSGKAARVETKGMGKKDEAESMSAPAHGPRELELILNTIYKPARAATSVDLNAPKQGWF